MRRIPVFLFFLPLLLLLCGFFWNTPTWEEINQGIAHDYPTVRHIDTDALKTDLEQGKKMVLIDVRKKEEYGVSHLPSAVNIINTKDVALPKDTPIIVYCSVGVRSAKFAKNLEKLGYINVLNLQGSIFEWANKSFLLMRENTKVTSVHPFNKKWGALLRKELHSSKSTKLPDKPKQK
jgi:rhodanese-related sulfurtransferase